MSNINEIINGAAQFDGQTIRFKCLNIKKSIAEAREKKLKEAKENQKSHADLFRKDYYLKSFEYRFKLKWGWVKDVDKMSDKDVINAYRDDILCTSTYRECRRLIDVLLEDEDALNYKKDLERLCDELILTTRDMKGDDIWLASNTWNRLNEKI